MNCEMEFNQRGLQMRHTVPPLHLGQQGKEAHRLALHQPLRLWQEILP